MNIKPRPLLRLFLLAAGVAVAQVAWAFLDIKLLAYLAGMAAPACMLCLAAVWSIRKAADDHFDGLEADAASFARFREAAQDVHRRAMYLAAQVAVGVVVASGPAIAHQLTAAVWQWMVLLSGASVGHCAYGYLIAAEWERQLREFKDGWTLQKKRDEARTVLLARIGNVETQLGPFGWSKSDDLLIPPADRH